MAAAQLLLVEDDTRDAPDAGVAVPAGGLRGVGGRLGERGARPARARPNFDVVLSDIKMPGKSGLELVGELRELRPDTPVVLMTAFGSIDTAVDAMRAGAFDYTHEAVRARRGAPHREARARAARASRTSNRKLRGAHRQPRASSELIGESAAMRDVFALIRRAAHVDATVLITGESGTGKEVVARTLHHHGAAREKPFVAINCAAIPETLLESELFGHVRGAFTGAHASQARPVRAAPTAARSSSTRSARWPRACRRSCCACSRTARSARSAARSSLQVDVRIIAATNRDLDVEIGAGRFREDLYYRLNVIPIHIPPLRERPDDIPALVGGVRAQAQRRAAAALLAPRRSSACSRQRLARQRARARERGRAHARAHRRGSDQRRTTCPLGEVGPASAAREPEPARAGARRGRAREAHAAPARGHVHRADAASRRAARRARRRACSASIARRSTAAIPARRRTDASGCVSSRAGRSPARGGTHARSIRAACAAALLLALGCTGVQREGAPPEAKEPPADRIYLGDILTFDASNTVAEALAVKDGHILLVGAEQTVLQHRGRDTEVVDLGGGALLPGLHRSRTATRRPRRADHGLGQRGAAAGRQGRRTSPS